MIKEMGIPVVGFQNTAWEMSVRRSPAGAGLLQEGRLPLRSHARGYLLDGVGA